MPIRAVRRGAIATAAILFGAIAIAFASSGASADSPRASAYSFGETYSLSFSPNQPKLSTSATFKITTPTQQPTSVTIALPAGSGLNTAAAPKCASPPTCEPSTQVGTGIASVTYKTFVIPLNYAIYNRPGGLAFVITLPNGPPVIVLPTWSGSQLTIKLPNGFYKGVPIVITQMALTFDSIGHGGGAFIRTPTSCPKTGWSSVSTFNYAGVTAQVSAHTKCTLPKKKKKKRRRR